MWAVDVNGRARDLCAANAAANGITNVRVVAPDDVPDDVAFDCIWSNPPIRVGKTALHEMLLMWLARLDADGYAVLVVHKHLGGDSLQRWLTEVRAIPRRGSLPRAATESCRQPTRCDMSTADALRSATSPAYDEVAPRRPVSRPLKPPCHPAP